MDHLPFLAAVHSAAVSLHVQFHVDLGFRFGGGYLLAESLRRVVIL